MANRQLSPRELDAVATRWRTVDREALGIHVRRVWVAWAIEQPKPKASWLAPWDRLTEEEKEVDRRIGMALWVLGQRDVQKLLEHIQALTADLNAAKTDEAY